jgi:hypothetical protein
MHTQIAFYDADRKLQEQTLPFFASKRHPLRPYRTAAARVAGGSSRCSRRINVMPRDFTSNLAQVGCE